MSFVPVMQLLIDKAKAQHEAIDILFTMLIERDSHSDPAKMFFPSESGLPWAAMSEARVAVATAEQFLQVVNDEASIEEAARSKMRDILHRTANVLKGDPGPLKLHSWHDLPEVAARMMDEARMRVTVDDPSFPKVNVKLVTENGMGSQYVDPVSVEHEDDGSLTVVVEAWRERRC